MCGLDREVCSIFISPDIPLAEAYILSEIPHLPWERPSPFQGQDLGATLGSFPQPYAHHLSLRKSAKPLSGAVGSPTLPALSVPTEACR